jgi:hypothetical protein
MMQIFRRSKLGRPNNLAFDRLDVHVESVLSSRVDRSRQLGGGSPNKTTLPTTGPKTENQVFLSSWVISLQDPGGRSDSEILRVHTRSSPAHSEQEPPCSEKRKMTSDNVRNDDEPSAVLTPRHCVLPFQDCSHALKIAQQMSLVPTSAQGSSAVRIQGPVRVKPKSQALAGQMAALLCEAHEAAMTGRATDEVALRSQVLADLPAR